MWLALILPYISICPEQSQWNSDIFNQSDVYSESWMIVKEMQQYLIFFVFSGF